MSSDPSADMEGYGLGNQTASDLTEIDEFLENTESEYISDEDDIEGLATIDELRGALRGKEKQIKSLRYAPSAPPRPDDALSTTPARPAVVTRSQ